MSEDNKTMLRRVYEGVIGQGNLALLDELAVPDFVDHNPGPEQAPGLEGVRQFVTALHAAVSDLHVSIEHIVSEGDTVAAHVTIRGRHTGDFMGIPPSGKDVVMRVSDIVRIEHGKAVERWGVEDMSGFLPQG